MNKAIPRHFRTAALLLAASVAVVAAVLFGNRSRDAFGKSGNDFVLYAVSQDGYGLSRGSPVNVRGIEVGAVVDVSLVHDPVYPDKPVRVTMRISRHAASFLGEATVAHVERIQMGPGIPPFASPVIDLRPGGESALMAGRVIEMVPEQTMGESFVQLSHDVAAVRAQLAEMRQTFTDIGQIASALAHGNGLAGKLIYDTKTSGDVSAVLRDTLATLHSTQKAMDEARSLAKSASPVLRDVKGLSQQGRTMLVKANHTMEDLPRIIQSMERTLELTEDLVVNLRAASAYAPELARKVDSSIEETNRMVDAAQRSILLRATMPDPKRPKTEAEVRPPIPIEGFAAP